MPTPGRIVRFEIPANDTAQAREFWSSLCGWELAAYPGPSEYHTTRISARTGAAITDVEPGKRGTRADLDVDEIGAGARVGGLGGESGEPMPVRGLGWFALCAGPYGNEFGIWQDDPSAPPPGG